MNAPRAQTRQAAPDPEMVRYPPAALSAALDAHFPRLEDASFKIPFWCVTANHPDSLHRFFDTSPLSPSGRFIAFTQLRRPNAMQEPGETARVIVIDLFTGKTVLRRNTPVWDLQVGCHIQWGPDDRTLYFNNMEPGKFVPFGVKVDFQAKTGHRMAGPVYMVSPDGRMSATACLRRMRLAQAGYSVVVPNGEIPRFSGATRQDGFFVTDLETGRERMLASMRRIVEEAGIAHTVHDKRDRLFGFHCKWNADSSRLMLVLRHRKPGSNQRSHLITMKSDGTDIQLALPSKIWARGGHHPNWHPDGKHIVMNLADRDGILRFTQFRYDGTGTRILSKRVLGSGHPSISANGRFVMTDAKPFERVGGGPLGRSPQRLIDLRSGHEDRLALFDTANPHSDHRLHRVDLHPAWDQNHQMVVVNTLLEGRRHVLIGAMAGLGLS